jgi:hypothetical protein
MKKVWKATFIITLEGAGNPSMTARIARDKLFVPLQEMWITGDVKRVDIQEVEPMVVKNILSHEDEPGERKSFYETGFPGKSKKNGSRKR